MPPLRGRGKKPAEPLREGDRGFCRPRALIRPFEVAWGRAYQTTDEDHYEATLNPHRGIMIEDDECPAARDVIRIVGVPLGFQPIGLGLKLA
jgi:hypothetical protein